jgi:hypothetical protein
VGADGLLLFRQTLFLLSIPLAAAILQEEMAQTGYRTLCVADKELTESQWETWSVAAGVLGQANLKLSTVVPVYAAQSLLLLPQILMCMKPGRYR